MARGRVRWFSEEKGFGLIEDDSGGPVLVHYTEIVGDGFRTLEEGGEVEFEVADDDGRRRRAARVEAVG